MATLSASMRGCEPSTIAKAGSLGLQIGATDCTHQH